MKKIVCQNQVLFPFDFESEFYYIRLVHRGRLLHCSGVFRLIVDNPEFYVRPVPSFEYLNLDARKTRRIAEAGKAAYLRGKKEEEEGNA